MTNADATPTTSGTAARDVVPEAGDLRDAPEIPAELRAAARRAPDHWLGMVDPEWTGDGPPPSWAVRGEWRSDAAGEIVQWRENEGYRPSPSARGWPPPTDEVDEAVQLAVTGYGPAEEVTRRLAEAEVAVPVGPDGRPLLAATPDGVPVVPVHTSAAQLHALGRLAYDAVPVTLLLDFLEPEQRLLVNPGGAASLLLETDALRRAVAGEQPPA
ncbi:SseB family protein [Streptomyces dangxiongensis]|uniref:SseB family protein n=1 Tax=Streptomyces dangxiongensis TaxID=1442032 RepID=A0A3G2JNT6_9ACTN|nr:type VII secretion system-associated protein [Streptomyces dangxiongensis]AYN43221.1 SseB family protein [Streptomyces dangxiongensis]